MNSFNDFMATKEKMLCEASTKGEKIQILDFLIQSVGRDMTYQCGKYIYDAVNSEAEGAPDDDFFIPPFVDSAEYESERYSMSLADCNFICIPWNLSRYCNAIIDVSSFGFRPDEGNYKALFFPELCLAVTTNGYHHSAAAFILRESADVDVYMKPLCRYFSEYSTDGLFWYHTSGIRYPVKNTFLAIAYALAQEKSKLTDATPPSVRGKWHRKDW